MKGRKTILVVEDDEAVRKIAVGMLGMLGYKLMQAEDSPSALKILSKHSKSIDLVFSDVVMPSGLDGYELSSEIKRHYPNIKVLLTSGFSQKGKNNGDTGIMLLRKPYKKAELADAVRTALQQ